MKILFLGCHCDDIELGCGGTIHKYKDCHEIFCHILCNIGYKKNKCISLKDTAIKSLVNLGVDRRRISFDNFEPNHYELKRNDIYNSLLNLKKSINPDLVISQIEDEHQDHVTLYNETLRVFREGNLYFYLCTYRSLSNFYGDVYEIISEKDLIKKNKSLKIYESVLGKKSFFDEDISSSIVRANGLYVKSKYAEKYKVFTKINIFDKNI